MRRLLAALVLIASLKASAQEAASFLKIGVGARALGMGGAYTAVTDDINSLYWNPAGLSNLGKRELGFTHAELAAGTRYDFLGYAQPAKYGAFGAGAAYLSQGAIEGRDASGHQTGGFSASDAVVNASLASKLESGYKLGGSVKVIQSRIADASAGGWAVDLGAQRDLNLKGPGIPMVGLAVQNLGPGMRFLDQNNPLPLTLAAGVGYRLPAGLILAADYKNRPNSRQNEVSVGTEYALLPRFSLRAGYGSAARQDNGSSSVSGAAGFAAGFGVKSLGYALDYSMTPFGELGPVQRISLGARF